MKIILRIFIIIFFITLSVILYLSFVGIETSRFNNQIGAKIKSLNKDLEIELQEVKIILDPLNLEINAKTIGPKIKLKDKIIELESIKTQITIDSFINRNFSLKNLNISTRSLKIENLISFTRNFKNTPELYILEKIIKKGFLIGDINLEFDKNGKIKDNYKVKGLVKDAQINFLKKYNFNNINLIFNLENKSIAFGDIKLSLNNTSFFSEEIIINEKNNKFLIDGSIQAKNLGLKDEIFIDFIKSYYPKLNLVDLNIKSKNRFSFRLDKKFKVDKFKSSSEIDIIILKFENNFELKKFFPNIKKDFSLNNHKMNIVFEKNNLSIKGRGDIFLQEQKDYIEYSFLKNNKKINYQTKLIIKENPILISSIAYKKEKDQKSEINLKGSYIIDGKILVDSLSYIEAKNKFKLKKLSFNKKLKIKSIDEIDLVYFDQDFRENQIKIKRSKSNSYDIIGKKFNANSLIENLLDNNTNNIEIFERDFNFNIKIDQVFLDQEHIVQDLNGNLNYKKNEIVNAELNALFSKSKILKFTIKTNESEKVTTLFLNQAEPIVKRFKFIKGYSGGSLDFYSSKKGKKSNSNLKIFDFRLKELPILTKLLTLASLQGIADILSGEGITFNEFEMNFENQNNLLTITEMYAIGPAISILMDGYVEKDKLISLRGSLVPATTINKAIGNIPVLGKILVGSKTGEGVFGVSFKIKGPPGKLETSVNPIKTLTPRFITRTLEKIKKN